MINDTGRKISPELFPNTITSAGFKTPLWTKKYNLNKRYVSFEIDWIFNKNSNFFKVNLGIKSCLHYTIAVSHAHWTI